MTGAREWPGLRLDEPAPGVARVTLSRPDVLNAFDDEMLASGFPEVLAAVAEGPFRVAILTGEGRAFCAGADLGLRGFALEDPTETEEYVRDAHRVPVGFRRLPIPVIAAVNGPAVGAGAGLALACDIRVAAAGAYFQLPFVGIGIVPDFGTSYFLAQAVGASRALELSLTGRRIDALEAERIGLVSSVADDVAAAALDLAVTIARQAPYAVRAARANVYAALEQGLEEQVLQREAQTQAVALGSAEFRRRFGAYVEALHAGS
jgi:enoyl-CoA hydratase